MQPASAAVGLIVVAAGSGSRLGADVPKARQILVSELALAEKTDEDKAESILDEVLAS